MTGSEGPLQATLYYNVQFLNRLTNGQIIGDSNDAGHWLPRSDACIRMSWDSFEIMGHQHPLQYRGFLQEQWVLQSLHGRVLDDHHIQQWNAQPQPAQDALIEVFVDEQA